MTMVNNVIEVLNYVIAAHPHRSITGSLTGCEAVTPGRRLVPVVQPAQALFLA